MTRWDYDTVFYRVFCTALLGVALTFTVILTNVFIDIDGLLYKKNRAVTEKLDRLQTNIEDVVTTDIMPDDVFDSRDYADSYGERTKRSLETQDYSFHIKDPKMKKVITSRLAALLDDLDKEEASKDRNIESNKLTNEYHKSHREKYTDANSEVAKNYKSEYEFVDNKKSREDLDNIELMNDIERLKKEKVKRFNRTEDTHHLALHNIILQGIIGHKDLGDVYARVRDLSHSREASKGNKDNVMEKLHPAHDDQIFNELVNCKELQKDIAIESAKTTAKPVASGRNVMIKTIIDITSVLNDKLNQDNASSKENVNGVIKLIYNGKSLKFKRVDEGTTTTKPKLTKDRADTNNENINEAEDKILNTNKDETISFVPNTYLNKMIAQYLKRLTKEAGSFDDNKELTTKRLKRHIKIRYDSEDTAKVTTNTPNVSNKNDDELYVEIETHFDSKGLKGEKKKKMIRDLIQKIQNAIHTDKEIKKKKHKHLHVKKRTQNPLDNDITAPLVNKALTPLDNFEHRELDPISKSVPLGEKLPLVSSDKGQEWSKHFYGPKFLTVSKAINSAEMSEVNADYARLTETGIPQRLQRPLNTGSSNGIHIDDIINPQDAQVILKNIAGSGFSIGFNQFVDEPPDAESMKLFTGIENIIQTYHQKYDEGSNLGDTENTENPLNQENVNEPVRYEYPAARDDHMIVRRSIKKFKQDYHSNEYKVIFNKNFLDYKNYQDVYNGKGHYSHAKTNANSKNSDPLLVIDDNIFNKDLKPGEIFSLADLLERRKRSLNVKQISNIKTKKKLNRYLNTHVMASKKIFQQKKRSKRQIDKIRIIAKDSSDNQKHNSEENIFLFSDEKIYADRAMVREVETPEHKETIRDEHFDMTPPQNPSVEHFDIISPQTEVEDHFDSIPTQKITENHYDIISPYNVYEAPQTDTSSLNNFFTRKSRHNNLMSKYPHIFMEEISRSKEDHLPESPVMYGKIINDFPVNVELTTHAAPAVVEVQQPQYIPQPQFANPDVQNIVNQYPPQEKGNYKVTVKIMPKNNTNVNSGFKEIHTSINKSFNKNGLVYTSLVNVSEISKVEKINKTNEKYEYAHPSLNKLKREQMKMKTMIQQHKDRIEEELAHLNREKEKLDRLESRNMEFPKDPREYINFAVPNNQINPGRSQHIAKEDLNRFFNIEETTTTTTTTEKPSTTEYILPLTEDPEKMKIINTIERNENITNEILQKINKNTDILQTFLDKLISKMETHMETRPKPVEYKNPDSLNNEEDKKLETSINDKYTNSIPGMFFQMPKQNTSGIPFVYAFQQPYTMPNGENSGVPIASVVYQGHIHAHTYKPVVKRKMNKVKPREWKNSKVILNKNSEVKNISKFFKDDIENEYKVLPVISNTVVNNTKI